MVTMHITILDTSHVSVQNFVVWVFLTLRPLYCFDSNVHLALLMLPLL
jgi:hypothetical protein